jgi:hypothetical protein
VFFHQVNSGLVGRNRPKIWRSLLKNIKSLELIAFNGRIDINAIAKTSVTESRGVTEL